MKNLAALGESSQLQMIPDVLVFHGTNTDFEGIRPSLSCGSVFLTDSPQTASEFALYKSTWQGANVRRFLLSNAFALVIDGDFQDIREVERSFVHPSRVDAESPVDLAHRLGANCLVFKNVRDDAGAPYHSKVSTVYQVFDTSLLVEALVPPPPKNPSSSLSL